MKTQNIIIPENLVPGSKVTQVQATGFDLRYEICSPVPSPLYTIGRGKVLGRAYGYPEGSITTSPS